MNNSMRSHIYETLKILDGFIGTIRVIKPEYADKWMELLTPEELRKYNALTPAEQLGVAMSCNPFRKLGAEE